MTRRRYIASKEGKWIPVEEWVPETTARSASIITDSMEPIRCMADHQMYDSKSKYNRAVKAAGCIVVGNEVPKQRKWEPSSEGIKRDIGRAMQDRWK